MCCPDDVKVDSQTQIRGQLGSPTGFEVPRNFMDPGGPFSGDDVLGAIYAKMGLPEEDDPLQERFL